MARTNLAKDGLTITVPGLSEKIIAVLTDEWQSAALIAAQVTVAPEAIERQRLRNSTKRKGALGTAEGNRANLVAQLLSKMRGVEKRKRSDHKNEYRLKPNLSGSVDK